MEFKVIIYRLNDNEEDEVVFEELLDACCEWVAIQKGWQIAGQMEKLPGRPLTVEVLQKT